MNLDDAAYFAARATFQIGCASRAADSYIARVHAGLSELYLERARDLVERERCVDLPDNVVPIRVGR